MITAKQGATVVTNRNELLASADILVGVNRPPADDFKKLRKGSVVLSFLRPLDEPQELVPALEQGLTTFSMELVPRITRAQAMDALSSMATVAGYKAVLLGADRIPRMFPLLMTAAGTVPPGACSGFGRRRGRACRRSPPRDVWAQSSKPTTCAPPPVNRCVRWAQLSRCRLGRHPD
jgi:NAD/NADP transhydrogenase alpha subunit